jgi:hypothetical protein
VMRGNHILLGYGTRRPNDVRGCLRVSGGAVVTSDEENRSVVCKRGFEGCKS